MVADGLCVTCGDTCLIYNYIVLDYKKTRLISCVKSCSYVINKMCCESCLERFNKGVRHKKGESIK